MTNYKELVKQRTSIPGYIEEVERFETWWNKNLATVISYYGGHYRVFLLVYDPVYNTYRPAVFPVDNDCNYWGEKSRGKHNYLSEVRSEANWLREELTYSWRKGYDNPILIIHPYSDCSRSFSELVKEPYVKKVDLPYKKDIKSISVSSCNCYSYCACYYCNCRDEIEIETHTPCSNPRNYLKPLDVVKVARMVEANSFYHFGIYLGNGQVCHYSDPNSKFKTDNNYARVTDWETFIKGCVDGEIIGCHVIVPFKSYLEIARNIAWDEYNNYGNLRYCLANNNCEHYVNSRFLGLNWSEQVAERPSKALANSHGVTSRYGNCNKCENRIVNNGENGDFNLRDRLNQILNKRDNYRSQEIERQYLQEVPTKDNNCRIM